MLIFLWYSSEANSRGLGTSAVRISSIRTINSMRAGSNNQLGLRYSLCVLFYNIVRKGNCDEPVARWVRHTQVVFVSSPLLVQSKSRSPFSLCLDSFAFLEPAIRAAFWYYLLYKERSTIRKKKRILLLNCII